MSFFASVFFLQSCTCSGGKNRTDSQVVNDMAQQNNVKAQEGTKTGEAYVKLPPEGTRARNRRYYPYTRDPLKAATELKNPLEPTAEILSQGQKYYKMYCIYCHGAKGDSGEGASVTPKMSIKPASLLTEKAKAYKDGRIYHIIYEGQGLMGAYNLQLESEEQVVLSHHSKDKDWNEYKGSNKIWSVVHYVRKLQNKITQTSSEEKAQDNSEEKTQDNSKEKAQDNSEEKAQDNSEEKTQDNSKEKASDNSKEKAQNNPEEKAQDNSKEKAQNNPEEKAQENSKEKAPENPEEKVPDNSEEKVQENSEEKAPDNSEEKASENSEEKTQGNSEEKASDNPEEKAPENPKEKTQDNSKEKTQDNSEEKTQDKNNKELVQ